MIEWVPNGTLLELAKKVDLSLSKATRLFSQIASAVYYLHVVKGLVHRDIKLENICIDAYNNARLIDFGLAKFLVNPEDRFSTFCGSYGYLAPEIVTGEPFSKPVDIWSLGICLYAMLCRRFPFGGASTNEIVSQIVNSPVSLPPDIPKDAGDLIMKMLEKNPDERITIEDVCRHPFIRSSKHQFYVSEKIFAPVFVINPIVVEGLDPDISVTIRNAGFDPLRAMTAGSEEHIIYQVLRAAKVARIVRRRRDLCELPRRKLPIGSAVETSKVNIGSPVIQAPLERRISAGFSFTAKARYRRVSVGPGGPSTTSQDLASRLMRPRLASQMILGKLP
jgi:serine/threonine protein kinase